MLNVRQDKRISIYQTYFVFVPLFSKPILTRQNIASTKNSQEFLASQVSVLRRNKATNSSTSNRPFFSCTESLVLGNLFKVFRLDITFAWEVCNRGDKDDYRRKYGNRLRGCFHGGRKILVPGRS